MIVNDSLISQESTTYSLSGGVVTKVSGGSTGSAGSYTISGDTLSITLVSAKYLISFTLGDD